ncbi:MAG: transglycosylase SLT domain-containing protein [Gemmatimonadaceae bacterium]|nr:transglycosylase SLT domain-containing protein [Gemmatimonadaceae bacterium]
MPREIHVVVPGGATVLRFTETVRIGRSESNGIVISDGVVSKEHLELRPLGDEWEAIDLGSTNGTYIDGKAITRVAVGGSRTLQLGEGGPEVHLTVPGAAARDGTVKLPPKDVVDRLFSEQEPANMSAQTQLLRIAVKERRTTETRTFTKRVRQYRVAVGLLVAVSAGAAATAVWQARRAEALRASAGAVFSTIKSLDLDLRRLEAKTGPDKSIQERRARLERQYDDLLKTLGIYNSRTPPDVQLIYRTVHRLGESEATVPRDFVDEVRKYIARWKAEDIRPYLARASQKDMGPVIAGIMRQHNLPREFFYLALQESGLNPRAIGPLTRFGVPKGMWQFIPPTAEMYGLKLGPLQGERTYDPADDRHNVAKASNAAAKYLEDLYTTDAQASGLLVMASYNMGETRLLKLIRAMPESPSDRNFWTLLSKHRKQIPNETYDYVFRVLSAAVIGSNPRLFGYDMDPVFGVPADSVGVVAAR